MGLESCTAEVQLADKFALDGRSVTLIDTPGFDDTTKSDSDILEMIAAFLATAYVRTASRYVSFFRTELPNRYEKGSKLSGVIYIHRISDIRFTGISGRNFQMFRELCGETTLKSVVLVTNMWTRDPRDINEAREIELSGKFFKPVLDKGAQLIRHHDTAQSAHDIIRKIFSNHKLPVVLQIQRELVDERKGIIETSAGKAVSRELVEQAKRHRAELEKIEEGMRRAMEEKNEEMRQELEEERRNLQEQVKRIEKESKEMALNYAVEKERMEAKMREMERESKEERERAEAKYKHQLVDLDHRLRDTNSVSAADRARLEKEVRRLQEQMEQIKKDSERMTLNYATEREKTRVKVNEVSQKATKEQAEAEYNRQLTELNRRPQDMVNASTTDRVRLEAIERLQNHDVSSQRIPFRRTPYVQVCFVTHDG